MATAHGRPKRILPQTYEPPQEPQRSFNFVELPYDTLAKIVSFLSIRDRGSWRLTSRQLQSAADAPTNLRPLIMDLVERYPGIYPDYQVALRMASEDMRGWYYKRIRMRREWIKSDIPLFAREAPAVHQQENMEKLYLVPGGRWLLLANSTRHSGLVGYNLDVGNMTSSELVGSDGSLELGLEEKRPNAESLVLLDVYMLVNSPILRFWMATFHQMQDTKMLNQWIRVWHVEEYTEGENTFLLSLRHAKMPIRNVAFGTQGLSLEDKLVAYFGEMATWEQNSKSWVQVFKWSDSLEEAENVRVGAFVCDPIYSMRIINNRVLCLHEGRVGIYGLPDLSFQHRDYIPSMEPKKAVATWCIPLDQPMLNYGFHISRPAYTMNGTGCHVVVNFGCGILELKISGSLWVDGRIIILPEHLRVHCSGLTRGCTLRPDEKVVNRVYYQLDEHSGFKAVQINGPRRNPGGGGQLLYFGFDEGTGRVVYSWKQRNNYPAFRVIDCIIF